MRRGADALQQVRPAAQPRHRHPRLVGRYGRVKLAARRRRAPAALRRHRAARGAGAAEAHAAAILEQRDERTLRDRRRRRAALKQALIGVGYPAEDLAGYTEGAALAIGLRDARRTAQPLRAPRLPAGRGRRLLRRRRVQRRQRRHRAALRRGQDDRRHRRDGGRCRARR